jgi:glyoxylase-like metal-dependent hydrolase (beta-lactamase superfamily II)
MKNILILLITISSMLSAQAQEKAQQTGYYGLQVGEFEVVALSDGTVPVDATELIGNRSGKKIEELLKDSYLDNPTETSINCYLIRNDTKLILIDTGAGALFGSAFGGLLVNSLKQAGYQPDDVTDILLTHIHKDHSGGLTIEGKALFANATIHLAQKEFDFWLNEEITVAARDNSISASKDNFEEAKKSCLLIL